VLFDEQQLKVESLTMMILCDVVSRYVVRLLLLFFQICRHIIIMLLLCQVVSCLSSF
jgi:hypothetical protein